MKKPRSQTRPGDIDRVDTRRVRSRAVVGKSDLVTERQLMRFETIRQRLRAALAAGCSYEECARALEIPVEVVKEFDIDA